jgi:hypothetical protein
LACARIDHTQETTPLKQWGQLWIPLDQEPCKSIQDFPPKFIHGIFPPKVMNQQVRGRYHIALHCNPIVNLVVLEEACHIKVKIHCKIFNIFWKDYSLSSIMDQTTI